ncbi:MAG: phytanoyl-CoA dioxygenase family protein [Mycobacteriales bacterium]
MLTSNGYVLDEAPHRLGELEPVPAAMREDRDALWQRLRRDGYLFLRGALDPDEILGFRAYYFRELAGTGLLDTAYDVQRGIAGEGEIDQESLRHILFKTIVPGPEYERLCTLPAIKGWYEWFLGDAPFLHRRKIIRHTRPHERGIGAATQAHYDLLYLRGGTDRVLSSWIPLGDCSVVRGGLTYLEASHRRVLKDDRDAPVQLPAASITADLPGLAEKYDRRWLVADYRPGDMVIHSAYTIHAALDNVGADGVMRLSTDIRYQRQREPIDWRWQNDWHDGDGL